MKRFMLLSALVIAMPLSMLAQDDDLYFTPKKNKSENTKSEKSDKTYYCGSTRSLDEYNRRGQYRSKVQPIEGSDSIDLTNLAGLLPDSVYSDSSFGSYVYDFRYDDEDDTDYTYSRMLDRWYGMYDPWFYGPGYYSLRWSPFYHGFYDPWHYGYGYYGYYDPWYYGYYGYYGLGYGGWYDPWYYGYGYYGYYNNWGYPYGHGYWGGSGGGWSHGGGLANTSFGRGNSAPAGGHSGTVGTGRRGSANTYNQIAKNQESGTRTGVGSRSNTNYGAGTRRGSTGSYSGTRGDSSYGTGTRSSSSSSYGSGSRSSSSYTPSSSYNSGSRSSSSSSYSSGSRSSSGSSYSGGGGSRSSSGSSGGGYSGGGGGGGSHSGRR